MRHAGTIAVRELRSIFATPIAYVVLAGYMLLAGYFFFVGLLYLLQWIDQIQQFQLDHLLAQANLNDGVISPAFGSFSIIMVILIPLVTMRVFAEERSNGTFELLLTSPLTIWEIVIGKYLATVVVVSILVALSALFPLLLFLYGDPEPLRTLAGLVGLLVYGMTLAALGCFASSLTRSQIIAAVIAIFGGLGLYLLNAAGQLAPEGIGREVLNWLAIGNHFEPWLQGLVRSEDLAFYGVSILLLLALTRLVVESLRWR